ncbi:MAG: response regulator [Proteobacteria bacterium]|nr:MAG: response regulator [Pseudomonadota bacterium]PIE17446.1 MAG: response regulator [Pseudomonadota bacterium]
MRVLIAEDDLTSREILCTLLDRFGHEVVATCDGAAAWDALQQQDAPELLVLDWMMPELDGVEVCRRLREQAQQPKIRPYVVMLTALDNRERIVTALDAGADDYIVKPFDPHELRARIDVGVRTLELQHQLVKQADDLSVALDEVQTLRGLIPICSSCKRIRDDDDFWHEVDSYLVKHAHVMVSHGLCPTCFQQLYGEFFNDTSDEKA